MNASIIRELNMLRDPVLNNAIHDILHANSDAAPSCLFYCSSRDDMALAEERLDALALADYGERLKDVIAYQTLQPRETVDLGEVATARPRRRAIAFLYLHELKKSTDAAQS